MKKYGKIILAGGSGQMGSAARDYFKDKAEAIIILSRSGNSINGNVKTCNGMVKLQAAGTQNLMAQMF